MAEQKSPPTLQYRTIPPRPRDLPGHWATIAGIAALLFVAAEVFWCALITAVSLLLLTGDIEPVGIQGLLVAALMALPLPLAVTLGIFAIRHAPSDLGQRTGLLAVIGAFCWLVFLTARAI